MTTRQPRIISHRKQSLRIVAGGVSKPPVDPDKPWIGQPREVHTLPPPEFQPWSDTAIRAVGSSIANAEMGHREPRKSSGLANLLITIFLGSAALYFAAQFIRLFINVH